eukprot:CAMPEP_0119382572 /NCGR_PEP_ID=MMETSP1334-20130426/73319_1 /TAXON_ID=127549 /ORGANISM="Calcidiscus leptoporus, Strain RCC1130" /LENGTH=32 /DNA_ID= /DNA_START= /DNA_END= /DNA_ORIENTATION=
MTLAPSNGEREGGSASLLASPRCLHSASTPPP